MNEILLGVVVVLYILGAYQGSTIADVIDGELEGQDVELTPMARATITWAWPFATIRAMMERDSDYVPAAYKLAEHLLFATETLIDTSRLLEIDEGDLSDNRSLN